MNDVLPGVLEKEWSEIEKKLNLIKTFTNKAHIDIIDGKFANNTTFLDPKPFKKYSDEMFLELHMMVDNPLDYLKPFADAGFKRFVGHIEKMPDIVEFVAQGQLIGEVGLAIDGPTNLDVLGDLNLNDMDCILIMTIKAGFSGQEFKTEHLQKVKQIRQNYPYLAIEVDGGVNDKTLPLAKKAGASRFVATSYISKAQNPQEKYQNLTHL